MSDFLDKILDKLYNFFSKPLDYITKKLNTNKNTFLTYIITLLCIYFAIDRMLEIVIIIFTGIGVDYWSIFTYIFALLLPFFGYALAIESKLSIQKERNKKFFKLYGGFFAFFITSVIVQYTNEFLWNIFFSAPNYSTIIVEDYAIIKRAFVALALFIPYIVAYKCFELYTNNFNSLINIMQDLFSASGFSLDGNKVADFEYSLDVNLGKDIDTEQDVCIKQDSRFQNTLLIGINTEMAEDKVIDSMIIGDIKKKRFLKEVSKNLAFNLLKSKNAELNMPNSNEYINNNFSIDMIHPVDGSEEIFESYTQKLKLDDNTYKDLGITYITENKRSLKKIERALSNFKMNYDFFNLSKLDVGLNPFANMGSTNAAKNISNIVYEFAEVSSSSDNALTEEAIKLVENIAIVLIETYPKTHDGKLPNYEDIYNLLKNLDLLEVLVGQFKSNADSVLNYTDVVNYFDNEIFVTEASKTRVAELTKEPLKILKRILQNDKLKRLLCNRDDNIDMKSHLKNADIVIFYLPKGTDESDILKMIILNTYNSAVLDRDLESKDNIPNNIYLPNFGRYLTNNILDIFNIYPKCNIALTVSAISLNQIKLLSNEEKILNTFKNIIVTNNATTDEIQKFKNIFKIQDTNLINNNIKISNDNIAIYRIYQNDVYITGYLKLEDSYVELTKDYTIREYDFENLKYVN